MSGCKSLLNNNPSFPVNFSAFSSESAAQLFVCERECLRLSDVDSVDADRLSLIVANIKDLNPFPNHLPDIMQYPGRHLVFKFRSENSDLDQEIQLYCPSKAAGSG